MIEAVNLTKIFGNFKAVNDISLNVPAGKVMALLGHNGAGKTTTTRMLAAILTPTSGYARIAGYDTTTQPLEVRKNIGHLTEMPGLYNRMRIEDYLDFFGELYFVPKKLREARSETMLKQFDLWDKRKLKLGEYSKGMRQKAALIRALIHEPKVLFLDEPTSAMDPTSAKMVRDAVAELKQENRAIILCTHNLFEAEMLADRIAIISKGEIIIEGTPEELKHKLLGAPSYTVQLDRPFDNGRLPSGIALPVEVAAWDIDRFTYKTSQPAVVNPVIVRKLVENGYGVVSVSEVPQSLESVYLKLAGVAAETSPANNKNRNTNQANSKKIINHRNNNKVGPETEIETGITEGRSDR